MATVDEACLVCAEPLEWTAFGECGHTEVCSRCVSRWRFVVQDTHCMMCKQEVNNIFFTRFMGDYTPRLTPEQFAELPAKAKRGELHELKEIGGFFDDAQHYQLIKGLCGYTHPFISEKCQEAGREVPAFKSVGQMKHFVENNYKVHFCDICIKSRKVFLCEQLLYDKPALDKHMRSGDDTGPLADTSFKGHPLCKFCRKRFYDSNELYRHMETEHEHCFLCRRANPGQYVYYRHYEELEDHFRNSHHMCQHESCLEKKFVVFGSEQELNLHIAKEHGSELKMSKAQRREALTIPVNLQYRDVRDAGGPSSSALPVDRPGVVIGGGYQVPTRHGRSQQHQQQQQQRQHMRHSRSTGEMYSSQQAQEDQDMSSLTFTSEDFPAVSGSSNLPMTGIWVGAVPGGGPSGSRGQFEEHFPALPSMTKAERKRLKNQQTSLAEQLRAANRPVRVLNRANAARTVISTTSGSGAASSSRGAEADTSPARPNSAMQHSRSATALAAASDADAFPALAPGSAGQPSGSGAAAVPAFASAAVRGAAGARSSSTAVSRPQAAAPSMNAADFPGLPTAAAPAVTGPAPAALPPRFTNQPAFAAAAQHARGGASSSSSAGLMAPAAPPLQDSDFPSLPVNVGKKGGKKGQGSKAPQAATTARKPASGSSGPASASTSAPAAAASAAADAAEGGSPTSGPSSAVVAANRALIAKIQAQLNDETRFAQFKRESSQFLRGELSAVEYHARVLKLGLMQLVPELAGTCPQQERCDALLDAHRQFLASPAAQDPSAVGPGWVPPEAAMAALEDVQARWTCSRCTLRNAADVVTCDACGAVRPGLSQPGSQADAFPSLSAAYGGPSSSSSSGGPASPSRAAPAADGDGAGETSSGKKKGKGGTKITIGLGAGLARPQPPTTNAWSGPASVAAFSNSGPKQAKGPNMWKAGGGDRVTKLQNSLNDAWGQ